jgi:hypothetical protein
MQVKVTSYGPGVTGWKGYVEPADESWILFVPQAGEPLLYPKRDPATGAALPLPESAPPLV